MISVKAKSTSIHAFTGRDRREITFHIRMDPKVLIEESLSDRFFVECRGVLLD